MQFLSTFITVVLLVALAVPGYILKKVGKLPEKSTSVLASILLYVAQPFLIVSSILSKQFSTSQLPDFAATFVLAILTQIGMYFAFKPLFLFIKSPKTDDDEINEFDSVDTVNEKIRIKRMRDNKLRRVLVTCAYLGNVGFMGIPVMEMLFPTKPEIVLFTVIYNVAFNAIAWTLGVFCISGDKKAMKPIKILLNPPTIAAIISLPLFILKVRIPAQVLSTVASLGNLTLPLSMIILGIRLANISVKRVFTNLKAYYSAFIKLVIAPLFSLAIMLLARVIGIPLSDGVIICIFVISAMPTAASVLTFSEMYEGDSETVACSTLLSTLLCVLTIPLLMMLITAVL